MLVLALVGCAAPRKAPGAAGSDLHARGLSESGLRRMASGMDPAMRALARRHDPGRRAADIWDRPAGWASLDVSAIPDLGLDAVSEETAHEINSLRPFSTAAIKPVRPFVLPAMGDDGARALQCLTQAVYYEAAREPLEGQQAVAQVILNRMRHPAYPKSVCGVVYQGSQRATGCQFTFTCDGSLTRAPQPALWGRAQGVARKALAGFVLKDVGTATHYHADYVAPYWAASLIKLKQVGAHIFYRWTGPSGEPGAFRGRYAGGEAILSSAILQGGDNFTVAPQATGIAAGRTFTLAVAGEVRTYTVVDPRDARSAKTRVFGTIYSARRQPTADEVRSINNNMAMMEAGLGDREVATPKPAGAAEGQP